MSSVAWSIDLKSARRALLHWYSAQNRSLPWREAFAKTKDPYPVWVSEIMLQQTLINVVVPRFTAFLLRFPTVEALAKAEEPEIRQAVAGLGYYRRFANLHRAARQLVDGGEDWPRSAAEWRTLPGVGVYTSAAIASITLGEPVAVLDGNVERVLCRLLDKRDAPAANPALKRELQSYADTLLERSNPGDFNEALMELGQLVCTKQNPSCADCPFGSFCLARSRSSQALAPAAKPRTKEVDVRLGLLVVETARGVALVRRPQTARFLKGAWGFPTYRADPSRQDEPMVGDGHAGTLEGHFVLGVPTVKHSITHHRITAEVRRGEREDLLQHFDEVIWCNKKEVDQHLVSNLDRKAWRLLRSAN